MIRMGTRSSLSVIASVLLAEAEDLARQLSATADVDAHDLIRANADRHFAAALAAHGWAPHDLVEVLDAALRVSGTRSLVGTLTLLAGER